MKKNFVTFLSPGTLVSESTTKPIDSWSVDKAVQVSKNIKERHGAIPYGFYFTTRARVDDELDSKITKTSSVYYLGGKIFSLEQLKARHDPELQTLICNMENNGWENVIENKNSFKITLPFNEGDVLINIDSGY